MRRPFSRPIKRTFGDALLHAVGTAIGCLYNCAFGGFEELHHRKALRRFAAEVEQCLAYLLRLHNGYVVPSEGKGIPDAFDFVEATVRFDSLEIQIVRGRGEFDIRIAPRDHLTTWLDPNLIWTRMKTTGPRTPEPVIDSLDALASWLEGYWEQIVAAAKD